MANTQKIARMGAATLFLLLLLFAFYMLQAEVLVQKRNHKTSLELSGRIDAQMYENVRQELAKNDNKINILYLDSHGGDDDSAIKIADLILEKNLDVTVKGKCVSACINLLLAGNSKFLSDGSFIGIHSAVSSSHYIYKHSEGMEYENLFHYWGHRQENLLKQRNIDPRLYLVAAALRQPVCVIERRGLPKTDFGRFAIGSKIVVFSPTKKQLEDLGVQNIRGYWPKDWQQAKKNSISHGFNMDFSILFNPKIVMSDLTIDRYIRSIQRVDKDCSG